MWFSAVHGDKWFLLSFGPLRPLCEACPLSAYYQALFNNNYLEKIRPQDFLQVTTIEDSVQQVHNPEVKLTVYVNSIGDSLRRRFHQPPCLFANAALDEDLPLFSMDLGHEMDTEG